MSIGMAIWLGATVVLALALIGATIRVRSLGQLANERRAAMKDMLAEEGRLHKVIATLRMEVAKRDVRIEDLAKQVVQEQNAYTRYTCTFCGGSGTQQSTGSVHLHPGQKLKAETPCDICQGDGYLYKRKVEPTEEQDEQERLAQRYKEGVEAAEVSLQTTDPAVLRVAAQEKLDDPYKVEDKLYRAYWRGFMVKVAEAIDELEEDMQVDTPVDMSSQAEPEEG